jgi:hypothetical protein
MNYAKPEVAVLGKAVRVIEQFPYGKTITANQDGVRQVMLNPAYDLDE